MRAAIWAVVWHAIVSLNVSNAWSVLHVQEEKRLYPPVVILMNVPRWKEWSEEQKKHLYGGTTKGQLLATFKDFQPHKADPIYGEGLNSRRCNAPEGGIQQRFC